MTLLPICKSSGSNLRRFFRALTRGQFANAFFPSVVHGDRASLHLRSVFESAAVTESQRLEYRDTFGRHLYDIVFRGQGEYAKSEYNFVIQTMNLCSSEFSAPHATFLLNDVHVETVDAGGGANRQQGRTQGRRNTAGTGGGSRDTAAPVPSERADPVVFVCKLPFAQPPDLGEHRESAESQATALAAQFAAEYAHKENDRAAKTLLDAHNGHNHLMLFDVNSQLRKQMIFASSWSEAGYQYNTRSHFAPIERPPYSEDERSRIQFGIDNEATAIRHVKAKYGFDLITPEHVKSFTRIHTDKPDVLAGSADAITTSGIILEIKCIRDRAAFLDRIANGGADAIKQHEGQVQALLELFDLPVGLLCYYHHTITEHGERVDPLSYEIPVYRKQGWWAEQSRIMERMIQKQRRKLTSAVWDDDIMKTSELMRWNNGNVP